MQFIIILALVHLIFNYLLFIIVLYVYKKLQYFKTGSIYKTLQLLAEN